MQARPAAVHPGAHGDGVEDAGIVFLDGVEGAEGGGEVFGVEPSADGKDGALDVLELGGEVARAPVFVVGVVLIGVVEERVLDLGGDGGELGADAEEVVVSVGGAVLEFGAVVGGELGLGAAGMEEGIEVEVGVEHHGSAVVGVVAHEEVSHRGFGGGGFDGGMGVDDGGGGEESGVGDAPDSDAAVVVRDVVKEPFDGVVHVGGFVGAVGFGAAVGTLFDEGAFGLVASADVLQDEDVSGAHEGLGGSEVGCVVVFSVGGDAVGRAGEEEGVGLCGVLGDVNGGEEVDAVAHGYAVFVFGVVGGEVVFGVLRFVLGEESGAEEER